MVVLQEILTWSKDLPDWQNDALVRLFSKNSLSSDDLEDIYALLKSEHGIPDPKNCKPQKLKPGQIATPAKSGTHIELLAIKNLINVNAIASNQKLSFAPIGLTIIYGDNGSGKSGYSRVLKRACRARDQTEPILPNASLPHSKTGKAEAIFEIKVNDTDQDEKWVDGKPAPELLSTIAIFDHLCARAYIDLEGDFSYIPYGFDIFDGLVKICETLKVRIVDEIDQNTPDLESLSDLNGSTAVGTLIENLSSSTEKKYVEKLATLTPEEIIQHSSLIKSINETDPKGKADQLRIKSRRISRLIEGINEKTKAIDNAKIIFFSTVDHDYLTAQSAAEIAANKFKITGKYLHGTGGEAWRELFIAARKFSEVAYPGKQFPNIEKGAQCPLCQQPLEDGAKRLQQFEEFIHQEAEKKSQECFNALSEVKRVFSSLDISIGLDKEIYEEISQSDEKLANKCQDYQTSLNARFLEISSSFSSHLWSKIPPLTPSPVDELGTLVCKLDKEVDILEQMLDNSLRKSLETQFYEYDSRIRLSKRKGTVFSVIEKLRRQSQLKECLSDLDTTNITRKRHEISNKVITKALSDSLKQEFRNLDVGNFKLNLKSRGAKGKTFYKLTLDLPGGKNPKNILSEGEQRAIAIASFLAEVNLSSGNGGIIFDDPVSSLDHRRREIVAKRLVDEAKKRQVIIFTHDIVFLSALIEDSEQDDVPVKLRSLVEKPAGFGVPEEGNPFIGMKVSERVKFLRTQQQEIDRIYKSGDLPEFRRRIKEAYSLLRSAWERAVEEVLFRKVISRFQPAIKTQSLNEVVVEDSDIKQINKGMTKCSKVTEAHDTAVAIGISVPKPDELLEDINSLETWRISVEKRTDEIRRRRK